MNTASSICLFQRVISVFGIFQWHLMSSKGIPEQGNQLTNTSCREMYNTAHQSLGNFINQPLRWTLIHSLSNAYLHQGESSEQGMVDSNTIDYTITVTGESKNPLGFRGRINLCSALTISKIQNTRLPNIRDYAT